MADKEVEDDLVDYDEEEDAVEDTNDSSKEVKKGSYTGIHASGFKDFLLKQELMRAVVDCGFEHPSEVQHECIPQAVLGMDGPTSKIRYGKNSSFRLNHPSSSRN